MKRINKFYTLLFLFLCQFLTYGTAHAFFRFTKVIKTPEGSQIVKVLYDGSNPINFPLQFFIVVVIIIAIFNYLRDPSLHKPKEVRIEEKGVKMSDLDKGIRPSEIDDGDHAIFFVADKIRKIDKNFSVIEFLKFAKRLYEASYPLRGSGEWGELSYFVIFNIIQALKKSTKSKGTIKDHKLLEHRVVDIESFNAGTNKVVVEFIESHKELNSENIMSPVIQKERWCFEIYKGVTSKTPEHPLEFTCPACFQKKSVDIDGICTACNKEITNGKYAWAVTLLDTETIPLSEYSERWKYAREDGAVKTILQRDLANKLENIELKRNAPIDRAQIKNFGLLFAQNYYTNIVADNIEELIGNVEYSVIELAKMYRSQIKVEYPEFKIIELKLLDAMLVRADADPFYEIYTVRVWAKMKYTIEENKDKKVQTYSSHMSDYITFYKGYKESNYKVLSITPDERYRP